MTGPRDSIFWNESVTLDALVKGASIARFGDGELKLCAGKAIKSQPYDSVLAGHLREILQEGSVSQCVVGIPWTVEGSPKHDYFGSFRDPKTLKLYGKRAMYGSAFITRADAAPWIDTPDYWSRVESLWRGRRAIIVRGSTKSLTADFLNARGAKSVTEIIVSRNGAYRDVPKVLRSIGRPELVILCCGPAATVLAWELAARGVQALDLGHVGMFMRGYPIDVAKQKLRDDPKPARLPGDNPKIQGWFKFAGVYQAEVERAPAKGAEFVEVGAWKGRSAHFMASAIKASGKKIGFHVVDHWEGSANHFDNPSVVKGTLYAEFLANVAPVRKYLNPIRGNSTEVARGFADRSLDFVMIDASHDYENVKADLAAWVPKIKKGGTIAGDDWNWSGVQTAARERFGDRIEVLGGGTKGAHWRVRNL